MSIDNQMRYGRFTSSSIGDLMTLNKKGDGFGAPALSLIKQKGMERRLQRSISNDMSSRETSWGHLAERRVFDLLGTDYNLVSKHTIVHPKYPFWAGSPDGNRFISEKTVFDIKCCFTLLSFCTLIDAWERGGIDEVRKAHKSGDTYYYQLVSNAILTDSTHAELIIYCPYLTELDEIRLLLADMSPEELAPYRWMDYAGNNDLPYLMPDGYYKNLNIMRFPIPDKDKELLTDAVVRAEKMLQPEPPSILIASQIPEGVLIQPTN